MLYIKKPIPVEAWHFTRANLDEADSWVRTYKDKLTLTSQYGGKVLYLEIDTLEGTMTAELGDYIIKGVRGELYSCREDIFIETYERYIEEEQIKPKGWLAKWKK